MGLALAKIKKLPKRSFTLGSYMSMVLFFSPMTLSPEIRNRIYKFSISLEKGWLIIYKMYLLMSSGILQKAVVLDLFPIQQLVFYYKHPIPLLLIKKIF
jgi:hypothetical protein